MGTHNLRQASLSAAAVMCLCWCSFFITGCATLSHRMMNAVRGRTACDSVLQKAFLERRDIGIHYRTDLTDPFSLNSVSCMLSAPAQMISHAETLARELQGKSCKLSELAALAANALEVPVDTKHGATMSELPAGASLPAAMQEVVGSLMAADRLFAEAVRELSPDELLLVKDEIEHLLFEGDYRQGRTRQESQQQIERAFMLAARINRQKIGQAFFLVAAAIDRALPRLVKKNALPCGTRITTALGTIVIGGYGDDAYRGEMPLLLVDPGGNDTYRFTRHAPLSVIIDLAGDDSYSATADGFPGAGLGGLGFLVDMQGDDRYESERYGFGCGFIGAGIIADFAGSDRYTTGVFGQGAATLGIGLLYDARGDDVYRCDLYGQGMGFVGGAGLLIDVHGNDIFQAGMSVPDSRETAGAFQTYAQGFGMGCRQYAGGGIGILYNGDGDDQYTGSYFCQGASYWRGLGLLIDAQGNDHYTSRRYAQGAGVHDSAGMLYDRRGDDVYRSWGVSQGCGHDYGVGMLLDSYGNDRYEAQWLSQGAGSSSGIGFLLDAGGNDVFAAGGNTTLQGSGAYDERRDAESIGIFVDRAGDDRFPGREAVTKLWRQGDVGAGIDGDGTCALIWREPAAQNCSTSPFVAAPSVSRGDNESSAAWLLLPELEAPLYLEDSWQQAAALLAARGPSILGPLCRYLAVKNVSVQRAIEETIKKLGRDQLDALHHFILHEDTDTKTAAFLLYVLGDIGSTRSQSIFTGFLEHDSSDVRAMALRGLYKLHAAPPRELWDSLSGSPDSVVRRFFCLALQASGDAAACEFLCRLLADRDFQVRHAAYRVLREKKTEARPFLYARRSQPDTAPAVVRMLDELLETEQ